MNFNEYQQHGWAAYAALASTISSILAAAIETEGGYRLQLVKERAKEANSLFKKLQERGIADTVQLEHEIKDLAGCRTVFYTNSDVEKFIHSGIIQENFDVLEVKLHQPGREVKSAQSRLKTCIRKRKPSADDSRPCSKSTMRLPTKLQDVNRP